MSNNADASDSSLLLAFLQFRKQIFAYFCQLHFLFWLFFWSSKKEEYLWRDCLQDLSNSLVTGMSWILNLLQPIMGSSNCPQSIFPFYRKEFLCSLRNHVQWQLGHSTALQPISLLFTQDIEVRLLSKDIEEEFVQPLIGGVCLKFVFVILVDLSRKSFNLLFGWITLICLESAAH